MQKDMKKRILIIDDEGDMRELIKDALEESYGKSIQVVEANDGLEGSFKIENQQFDCIITDLQMPRRGGVPFIKKAKESELNRHAPIIILTGNPDPAVKEMFKNVHMIAKPFDTTYFLNMVNTQLRLGKLHERIGAETLNHLAGASQQFAREVLAAQEAAPQKPQLKSPNMEVGGATVCSIELSTTHESGLMVVGLDESIINKYIEVSESDVNKDTAENLITNWIFKAMGLKIFHSMGQPPKFSRKVLFKDLQDFKYDGIKKSAGIILPISTDFGTIYVGALNNKIAQKKGAAA